MYSPGMISQPMIPPPTVKAGGVIWCNGTRMGVYGPPDPVDGSQTLEAEYRLMPDGWRIVVDPIEPLEAGG
jgi:hypothetical protein